MSDNGTRPHDNPIDALLADPLIQVVMAADRVDPRILRRQLCEVAAARRSPGQAAIDAAEVDRGLMPGPAGQYRPGVGIVLLNTAGEVLVARRIDDTQDGWQMPQGGIEPGETPLTAAQRELREEIGTDNVSVIAESNLWLRYDLPMHLVGHAWGGRWRGQQQKWFAMRFLGADSEFSLATSHPEFSAWRWAPARWVPELIVDFKRALYRDVFREFAGLTNRGAETVVVEPTADAPGTAP